MFRIDVLQNQWVVEALIGGAAFLLVFILWYVAQWQPRPSDSAKPSLPGIIIFVYVGTAVCAVVYLIARAFNPPNW